MNLEIISTIIFFSLVGILLLKDRKSAEFHYGIIIRRWKKGKEIIDNLVKNHEKIISRIGTISVVIGIIAGIFGFITLIVFSFRLERMFGLVLPTAGGYQYPGPIISIPFWYWIIGAFVIMITHESMHAVYARLEKIPIKNYGILLLLVLPIGAFVDFDMKRVNRLKTLRKLKILTAGSFANFLTAAIVLLIGLAISTFLFQATGVSFAKTVEGSPASTANLTGVIKSINGIEVKTLEDFTNILNNTKVGEEIEIATTNSTYRLTTTSRPDNQTGPYIGIASPATAFNIKFGLQNYSSTIEISTRLLFWLFVLGVGVGTANLLPLKPFDGGLVWEEILIKKFKQGRNIVNILTAITIFLILFNLFGIGIVKGIIG